MFMHKTKKRSLILALMIAMVLTVASWTMAGAAQLIITCPQAPDPCPELMPGTYDIGIGGYAVDQNGNITIALDNAPYSGVIAGIVDPLPPIPDVTVYLRKAGLSTGLSDIFYTPELDGALMGKYTFPNLPDGTYVVTVVAAGYQFINPYHTVKIFQGLITKIDGLTAGASAAVNFAYAPSVAGVCGSSNGQTLTTTPTTNLCGAGTASAVSGSGPWTWSCAGSFGGTTASCSANKQGPVAGVCGSSNGQTLNTAPTTNLCGTGTASAVSGSGPWTWSCAGSSGGTTASCSANKQGTLTNGVCGSSNGQTLTTAPTTNLCGTGTASAVSGSGPWTWSCTGSSGGTTAGCSANKQGSVPGIDLGTAYPKTTKVSLAAGQAGYYYFYTTTAAASVSVRMTTTDWTGNLDLITSNVKQPTCDQFTLRYSMGTNGLWYGPIGTSNEAVSMNISLSAGTPIYVTVCNRSAATGGVQLYWTY